MRQLKDIEPAFMMGIYKKASKNKLTNAIIERICRKSSASLNNINPCFFGLWLFVLFVLSWGPKAVRSVSHLV